MRFIMIGLVAGALLSGAVVGSAKSKTMDYSLVPVRTPEEALQCAKDSGLGAFVSPLNADGSSVLEVGHWLPGCLIPVK